jgi:hypothetical protein
LESSSGERPGFVHAVWVIACSTRAAGVGLFDGTCEPVRHSGYHRYFSLHEFPGAVAKTQLDVVAVCNDRHSYYLTCKAWVEKLEAARGEITRRWGEAL